MSQISNAVRLQAQRAMLGSQDTVRGIVTGYDPDAFAVKVMIMPEEVPTGWLPLASPWIGNGWGMMFAPSIGDAVSVHFFDGEIQSGYVEGRFYNNIDRPLSVQSGEAWLVHSSGSFVKLTNDGKLLLNGSAEIDMTAPVLNVTTTGAVTVNAGGNVSVSAAGSATVSAASAVIQAASISLQNAGSALKTLLNSTLLTWLASHQHTNGNGGYPTGAPTSPIPGGVATSVVQAE